MTEATRPGEQPGDEQKEGGAASTSSTPEHTQNPSATSVQQDGPVSDAAPAKGDDMGFFWEDLMGTERPIRPSGMRPEGSTLEYARVGLVENSDAETADWLYRRITENSLQCKGHALFANIGGALFMCHRVAAGYVWRPATFADVYTLASKASHRYQDALMLATAQLRETPQEQNERRQQLANQARFLGKRMADCEKASTINNLAKLLHNRLTSELPSMPERKANADRLALACGNGLVNLRDGSLRWIRPDDYVTTYTETVFDPEQDTSEVEALVCEIAGSDEYARFLHVWHGYGATGSTKEHCLLVEIGGGRNGKSTINAGVVAALGAYACPVPEGLLEQRGKHADSTDNSKMFANARLLGKRYMFASETGDRQRFSDAQVKRLTGEHTVSGRFSGKDYIDIEVQAKFTVQSQHMPGFDGRDQAMRKRLRVMEFKRTYGSQEDIDAGKAQYLARIGLDELVATDDPKLGRRAWLAWLVKGARIWIADGLAKHTPAGVRLLTDKHAQNNDLVAMFVRDVLAAPSPLELERAKGCQSNPRAPQENKLRFETRILYAMFLVWCKDNGHPFPLTSRKFADQLVAAEMFGEDIAESGEVRPVSLGQIERIKAPGGGSYLYRYVKLNDYGRELELRVTGNFAAARAATTSGDTEERM
jgi:P4 family phage/plasmid primase-like protien